MSTTPGGGCEGAYGEFVGEFVDCADDGVAPKKPITRIVAIAKNIA